METDYHGVFSKNKTYPALLANSISPSAAKPAPQPVSLMLKQRIIAKILLENGQAVKYRKFTEGRRVAGNPVTTMRIMSDQNLDEFFICDLGVISPALVREMTAEVFTPVTVAGGIKTMDHVDALIKDSGADKVVITNEMFARQVAHKYGNQAVVWPVDYCGDACFFEVPDCAGEIILTSVDRDGCGIGFEAAAARFPYTVPVILAGGCGKLAHVKEAFAAGADGVAISSMFFFSDKSPVKLRSWLVSEGANVRAG